MSIHQEIKRLRESKGWSYQTLAEEIHKHEQGKKVMSWQSIQQWENGTSAPTRKRMPFVADALGVTLQELQGLEADGRAPTANPPDEARLLSAYRLMPEERRAELIEHAMNMVRASNPDVARLLPPPAAPLAKPKPARTGPNLRKVSSPLSGKARRQHTVG